MEVVVLLLLALLGWRMRERLRAALVCSIAITAFMNYGHLYRAVEGRRIGDVLIGADLLAMPVILLASAGLTAVALRVRSITETTTVVNVVAGALVLTQLVSLAISEVPALGDDRGRAPSAVVRDARGSGGPDIVMIVPDRYAGSSVLQDVFGFDNTPFLDRLRRKGFVVADRSSANYPSTGHSLASALNMTYLDQLAARARDRGGDWQPIWDAIGDNAVARFLKARGYTYVHVGSWYEGTRDSPLADVTINNDDRSEFSQVLWDTSMLRPIARVTGLGEDRWDSRRSHWRRILLQLDAIRAADRPGPTFTFAHLLTPHYPFAFTPDGAFVPLEEERTMTRAENYRRQVMFANARLEALIDDLLDRPVEDRPVIVLMADEGSHPLRAELDDGFAWARATAAELREKFPILNAVYVPGETETGVYPEMSPVNEFRVLFSTLFDADLPRLPDRQYVFRDPDHLYDIQEVTPRLGP